MEHNIKTEGMMQKPLFSKRLKKCIALNIPTQIATAERHSVKTNDEQSIPKVIHVIITQNNLK